MTKEDTVQQVCMSESLLMQKMLEETQAVAVAQFAE
jgi:hypothetical protein